MRSRDGVLERSGPIESNQVVAVFNRVMSWASAKTAQNSIQPLD